MKIRYVHSGNPNKERELDTRHQQVVDAAFIKNAMGTIDDRTDEEYDKYILEKLERDKEAGRIIRYEVIEPKIQVMKGEF